MISVFKKGDEVFGVRLGGGEGEEQVVFEFRIGGGLVGVEESFEGGGFVGIHLGKEDKTTNFGVELGRVWLVELGELGKRGLFFRIVGEGEQGVAKVGGFERFGGGGGNVEASEVGLD